MATFRDTIFCVFVCFLNALFFKFVGICIDSVLVWGFGWERVGGLRNL